MAKRKSAKTEQPEEAKVKVNDIRRILVRVLVPGDRRKCCEKRFDHTIYAIAIYKNRKLRKLTKFYENHLILRAKEGSWMGYLETQTEDMIKQCVSAVTARENLPFGSTIK